jgi:excisionase family DNA binding protein
MSDVQQPLLTVEELAERYKTTPKTVYGWLYKGTAPRSVKPGRRRLFRVDDVLAWEDALAGQPLQGAGGKAR